MKTRSTKACYGSNRSSNATLLDLPKVELSGIFHKLDFEDIAQLKLVSKSPELNVPLSACLGLYALDWSTDSLPSAMDMKQFYYGRTHPACYLHLKPRTVDGIHYLFSSNLWDAIFRQDDVEAATHLLLESTGAFQKLTILDSSRYDTALQSTNMHIDMCTICKVHSTAMWAVLVQFGMRRHDDVFDLQDHAFSIYLHESIDHHNAHSAHRILTRMVEAGVDPVLLAREVLADENKLERLWYATSCVRCHMRQLNPIVIQMSSPQLLVELCSRTEDVNRLRVLFGIYVFHEAVKNCTLEIEDKVLALLARTFHHSRDERNQINAQYETVLEVLYKKRPLNRKVLQFFNSWKHNTTEFLE